MRQLVSSSVVRRRFEIEKQLLGNPIGDKLIETEFSCGGDTSKQFLSSGHLGALAAAVDDANVDIDHVICS